MESLLNILWALIAIAALGVWRLRWVPQARASRRHPACQWTAMIAALVLLFFAVSLSDDLHAQQLLSDDGASARRHACAGAAGQAANPGADVPHPIVVATLPSAISLAAPQASGETPASQNAPVAECAHPSASGRAPPVVNL